MGRSLREQFDELRLSYGAATFTAGRADDTFILRLIQLLFQHGVTATASDLHLEPIAGGARIRYRIDGILHELLKVPEEIRDPLLRAIKTRANFTTDTVGRSKPQDGRIDFDLNGKTYDLRISSFPTLFGDVLAIRILDRTAPRLKLEQLGFPASIMEQFTHAIRQPSGFILVTGPMNSGKTTTLYAALEQIRSPHIKIVTLEDPVEYQIDGINQAQINPQAGLTFASGLRAILRQDANAILVGEIRDADTVEIAIRASLTGHVVFSTLHTRHACGAVTRLMDMEIEPHLIAAALSGVLAMRLVRLVCRQCQVPDPYAEKTYTRLLQQHEAFLGTGASGPASPPPTFCRGKGCPACNNTGYRGRTGVFEFLQLNEGLRAHIIEHASSKLYQAAVTAGMRTMMMDGLDKAAQGLTTIEEVLRVIGESEEQ